MDAHVDDRFINSGALLTHGCIFIKCPCQSRVKNALTSLAILHLLQFFTSFSCKSGTFYCSLDNRSTSIRLFYRLQCIAYPWICLYQVSMSISCEKCPCFSCDSTSIAVFTLFSCKSGTFYCSLDNRSTSIRLFYQLRALHTHGCICIKYLCQSCVFIALTSLIGLHLLQFLSCFPTNLVLFVVL